MVFTNKTIIIKITKNKTNAQKMLALLHIGLSLRPQDAIRGGEGTRDRGDRTSLIIKMVFFFVTVIYPNTISRIRTNVCNLRTKECNLQSFLVPWISLLCGFITELLSPIFTELHGEFRSRLIIFPHCSKKNHIFFETCTNFGY